MPWILYETAAQTATFLAALERLHRPLLERVPPVDRPWFADFWLHTLNVSECHLLEEEGRALAVATYPRVSDTHYYRWQSPTLAVESGAEIRTLPRPLDNALGFTVPALGPDDQAGFRVGGTSISVRQVCTTAYIGAGIPSQVVLPGIEHRVLRSAREADAVCEVFESRIAESGEDAFFNRYYVPAICRDLASPDLGRGWCVYSVDRCCGSAIAAAYYCGWRLPLGGPPAALVEDIVVLPEYRRRGVASSLQRFAYAFLGQEGVRWACGNIQCENLASLRQSQKLERLPWSLGVRITGARR
jgi:GNAT superfamily N-acetyltransferase